jgi:hypothetical protein
MESPRDNRTVPAPLEKPQSVERAVLSAVLPGLGQFAQGRLLAGSVQLGSAVTWSLAAFLSGNLPLLWLALGWNVWSAIDAWRSE